MHQAEHVPVATSCWLLNNSHRNHSDLRVNVMFERGPLITLIPLVVVNGSGEEYEHCWHKHCSSTNKRCSRNTSYLHSHSFLTAKWWNNAGIWMYFQTGIQLVWKRKILMMHLMQIKPLQVFDHCRNYSKSYSQISVGLALFIYDYNIY